MESSSIVIFNDTHGWHSNQLVDALAELGIDTILADLADCYIDIDRPDGLYIPGFADQLPTAVIVRGIAPGTLEQITLRMDVLHTLAECGVPVLNPASAIEHTVDKARTSLRLMQKGVRTPRTWSCENRAIARSIVQKELSNNHQLVLKPLFGCQGKNIEKIEKIADFDSQSATGDAFYLQQYIASTQQEVWQDWRLMVIDGQVCAAMSRRSHHWITNFAQGAECFATTVSAEMEQLAIAATSAVNAEYAGVDLIQQQDGSHTVLEVNSIPAWKGLYQATGINIASIIAHSIQARIEAYPVQVTSEHA